MGRCRKVKSEGTKGRELLEKRRGTSASLYWRRAGLADEVGFDAMLDAAGGEATKPQGVVHRYQSKLAFYRELGE